MRHKLSQGPKTVIGTVAQFLGGGVRAADRRGWLNHRAVSTVHADGSSDKASLSTVVHLPAAHTAAAVWRARLGSPAATNASATAVSTYACGSGVGERAGGGFGFSGHGDGLLSLAGLGQRPGHRRQRPRASERVGERAG